MTHAGGPIGSEGRLELIAARGRSAVSAETSAARAAPRPSPLAPKESSKNGSLLTDPAFEALRLNILGLLPRLEGEAARALGAPIISLFSGSPGEGVSTIAVGLATAFARATDRASAGLGNGPVLVIEAGGSEGNASLDSLGPRQPALSEAGSTPSPLPGVLSRCAQGGVDVLTLGHASGKQAENGGGGSATPYDARWPDTLAGLRKVYSCIVVDCGALTGPAPSLWMPWASAALLVINCDSTTEYRLLKTRSVLETRGIPIHGTVLNRRPFPIPPLLYRFFS